MCSWELSPRGVGCAGDQLIVPQLHMCPSLPAAGTLSGALRHPFLCLLAPCRAWPAGALERQCGRKGLPSWFGAWAGQPPAAHQSSSTRLLVLWLLLGPAPTERWPAAPRGQQLPLALSVALQPMASSKISLGQSLLRHPNVPLLQPWSHIHWPQPCPLRGGLALGPGRGWGGRGWGSLPWMLLG